VAEKKKKCNLLFSYQFYRSSCVLFVDTFYYFGPSFIQLSINDVLKKPDLVSVVTVHMVYFCAFARSEIFHKNAREVRVWVEGNFMQESMG